MGYASTSTTLSFKTSCRFIQCEPPNHDLKITVMANTIHSSLYLEQVELRFWHSREVFSFLQAISQDVLASCVGVPRELVGKQLRAVRLGKLAIKLHLVFLLHIL